MNVTMKSAVSNAIFGVRESEEAFEECELCYNLTCISSLSSVYDKEENCYKLCKDCFDIEPKTYVKFGEYLGEGYGSYYFKN